MTVQFSHTQTMAEQRGERYSIDEIVKVTVGNTRYSLRAADVIFMAPGLSGKPVVYVTLLGVVGDKAAWVPNKNLTAAVRGQSAADLLGREIVKDALQRRGLRVKDVEIL